MALVITLNTGRLGHKVHDWSIFENFFDSCITAPRDDKNADGSRCCSCWNRAKKPLYRVFMAGQRFLSRFTNTKDHSRPIKAVSSGLRSGTNCVVSVCEGGKVILWEANMNAEKVLEEDCTSWTGSPLAIRLCEDTNQTFVVVCGSKGVVEFDLTNTQIFTGPVPENQVLELAHITKLGDLIVLLNSGPVCAYIRARGPATVPATGPATGSATGSATGPATGPANQPQIARQKHYVFPPCTPAFQQVEYFESSDVIAAHNGWKMQLSRYRHFLKQPTPSFECITYQDETLPYVKTLHAVVAISAWAFDGDRLYVAYQVASYTTVQLVRCYSMNWETQTAYPLYRWDDVGSAQISPHKLKIESILIPSYTKNFILSADVSGEIFVWQLSDAENRVTCERVCRPDSSTQEMKTTIIHGDPNDRKSDLLVSVSMSGKSVLRSLVYTDNPTFADFFGIPTTDVLLYQAPAGSVTTVVVDAPNAVVVGFSNGLVCRLHDSRKPKQRSKSRPKQRWKSRPKQRWKSSTSNALSAKRMEYNVLWDMISQPGQLLALLWSPVLWAHADVVPDSSLQSVSSYTSGDYRAMLLFGCQLGALLWAFVVVLFVFLRPTRWRSLAEFLSDGLITLFIQFQQSAFLVVAGILLSATSCMTDADGRYVLTVAPDGECSRGMQVAAWIAVILYGRTMVKLARVEHRLDFIEADWLLQFVERCVLWIPQFVEQCVLYCRPLMLWAVCGKVVAKCCSILSVIFGFQFDSPVFSSIHQLAMRSFVLPQTSCLAQLILLGIAFHSPSNLWLTLAAYLVYTVAVLYATSKTLPFYSWWGNVVQVVLWSVVLAADVIAMVVYAAQPRVILSWVAVIVVVLLLTVVVAGVIYWYGLWRHLETYNLKLNTEGFSVFLRDFKPTYEDEKGWDRVLCRRLNLPNSNELTKRLANAHTVRDLLSFQKLSREYARCLAQKCRKENEQETCAGLLRALSDALQFLQREDIHRLLNDHFPLLICDGLYEISASDGASGDFMWKSLSILSSEATHASWVHPVLIDRLVGLASKFLAITSVRIPRSVLETLYHLSVHERLTTKLCEKRTSTDILPRLFDHVKGKLVSERKHVSIDTELAVHYVMILVRRCVQNNEMPDLPLWVEFVQDVDNANLLCLIFSKRHRAFLIDLIKVRNEETVQFGFGRKIEQLAKDTTFNLDIEGDSNPISNVRHSLLSLAFSRKFHYLERRGDQVFAVWDDQYKLYPNNNVFSSHLAKQETLTSRSEILLSILIDAANLYELLTGEQIERLERTAHDYFAAVLEELQCVNWDFDIPLCLLVKYHNAFKLSIERKHLQIAEALCDIMKAMLTFASIVEPQAQDKMFTDISAQNINQNGKVCAALAKLFADLYNLSLEVSQDENRQQILRRWLETLRFEEICKKLIEHPANNSKEVRTSLFEILSSDIIHEQNKFNESYIAAINVAAQDLLTYLQQDKVKSNECLAVCSFLSAALAKKEYVDAAEQFTQEALLKKMDAYLVNLSKTDFLFLEPICEVYSAILKGYGDDRAPHLSAKNLITVEQVVNEQCFTKDHWSASQKMYGFNLLIRLGSEWIWKVLEQKSNSAYAPVVMSLVLGYLKTELNTFIIPLAERHPFFSSTLVEFCLESLVNKSLGPQTYSNQNFTFFLGSELVARLIISFSASNLVQQDKGFEDKNRLNTLVQGWLLNMVECFYWVWNANVGDDIQVLLPVIQYCFHAAQRLQKAGEPDQTNFGKWVLSIKNKKEGEATSVFRMGAVKLIEVYKQQQNLPVIPGGTSIDDVCDLLMEMGQQPLNFVADKESVQYERWEAVCQKHLRGNSTERPVVSDKSQPVRNLTVPEMTVEEVERKGANICSFLADTGEARRLRKRAVEIERNTRQHDIIREQILLSGDSSRGQLRRFQRTSIIADDHASAVYRQIRPSAPESYQTDISPSDEALADSILAEARRTTQAAKIAIEKATRGSNLSVEIIEKEEQLRTNGVKFSMLDLYLSEAGVLFLFTPFGGEIQRIKNWKRLQPFWVNTFLEVQQTYLYHFIDLKYACRHAVLRQIGQIASDMLKISQDPDLLKKEEDQIENQRPAQDVRLDLRPLQHHFEMEI